MIFIRGRRILTSTVPDEPVTPSAPTIHADDEADTLYFTSSEGNMQLSVNNGSWTDYNEEVIDASGDHSYGYWRCRVKAEGINPAGTIAYSPVFNQNDEPEPPDEDLSEVYEPETFNRTFTLTKSGSEINFNGNSFSYGGSPVTLQDGDLLIIPPGTYTGINFENINMPSGQRVYIKNGDGLVEFSGFGTGFDFENLNGVSVLGNGSSSYDKGFLFHNNDYRCNYIENINNFTFAYAKFDGIGDNCIYGSSSKVTYNAGNPSTWMENVIFTRIEHIDSSALISFGGGFDDDNDTTLYNIKKNWTVSYCDFHDGSPGIFVWLFGVEDANLHHNTFNNVNTGSNNHNGLFQVSGNGKVHHNKATNHQGNLVRFWNVNWSSGANRLAEVYHNKIYNSRKYSGFEISPQYWQSDNSTLYHPCNFKAYNNTVGLMDAEHNDFAGRIMDTYNIPGATGEFYNNLGFQLDDGLLINYASGFNSTGLTVNENNLYYSTAAAAVNNTTDLSSLHEGVGAEDW